jgi:hypothetical protein
MIRKRSEEANSVMIRTIGGKNSDESDYQREKESFASFPHGMINVSKIPLPQLKNIKSQKLGLMLVNILGSTEKNEALHQK